MIKPYFETKNGQLFHGECLEVMQELDIKADLCLTDPPYGIGIANNPVRQKHEKKDWDSKTPEQSLLNTIIAKATNSILWGGNYFDLPATQCFIIWNKCQPEDFSLAMCEMAWTTFSSPAKMFTQSVHKEKCPYHPTQKPVALFKWCLEKYSKTGDLILDPFAGSGTTAVACELLGRRWILIEQDLDYVKIAAKRIKKASEQFSLFEGKR